MDKIHLVYIGYRSKRAVFKDVAEHGGKYLLDSESEEVEISYKDLPNEVALNAKKGDVYQTPASDIGGTMVKVGYMEV
jgi:hypothetical protein